MASFDFQSFKCTVDVGTTNRNKSNKTEIRFFFSLLKKKVKFVSITISCLLRLWLIPVQEKKKRHFSWRHQSLDLSSWQHSRVGCVINEYECKDISKQRNITWFRLMIREVQILGFRSETKTLSSNFRFLENEHASREAQILKTFQQAVNWLPYPNQLQTH